MSSKSSSSPRPSKGIQFWTLLILSIIVSMLMVGEIFISRSIIKQQHLLVDAQETAETGPYYKDAWQKLAVSIWKSSAQDPDLLALLKNEGVGVHQGPPPGSAAPGFPAPGAEAGATNAAPAVPAPAH